MDSRHIDKIMTIFYICIKSRKMCCLLRTRYYSNKFNILGLRQSTSSKLKLSRNNKCERAVDFLSVRSLTVVKTVSFQELPSAWGSGSALTCQAYPHLISEALSQKDWLEVGTYWCVENASE